MPLIVPSISVLLPNQFSASLPATVYLAGCLIVALWIAVVVAVLTFAALPIAMLVMKRSLDPFPSINRLPPMPYPWWLPNRHRHTEITWLGHRRGQILLSIPHLLLLFVKGTEKVDQSFSLFLDRFTTALCLGL